MSWLERIVRGTHPKDPVLAKWLGGGSNTMSGVSVTPDTALREAAVYACVRVLAESVAQLPLSIYQRRDDGGKDQAYDHPLYEVLHDKPNRVQTSFEFREQMMAITALRGNGISRIVQAGGRGVAELMPMNPDRLMEIFRAPDGRRAYRFEQDRGPDEILLQHEVFHIPGLSFDGLSGLSPIAYHRETIGANLAVKEYGSKLFGNGAKPGGILKHPGQFRDKATRDRVRESWDAFTSGGNTGKTAVLEDGMEWTPAGMTNEDAQFLDTRKFGRTEIASIFRVPLYKIAGDTESTKGWSTLEQQSTDFVTDTLMPWIARWEQAISRDLISEQDRKRGYFAKFNLLALMRGDAAARSAYYQARFNIGSLTPNKVRELEDENPVDGGDSAFVPLNMIPIEMAGRTLDGTKTTGDTK